MRLHEDWKSLHRRGSVRAMIAGAVVQAAGGAWSSLPGSVTSAIPLWAVCAVSGGFFVAGLALSYVQGGTNAG